MVRAASALQRFDLPLNLAAAALGTYAAVANLLRGVKVPDEGFWAPWRWTFVVLLTAVVFVPLFALYKYFLAQAESQAKQTAEQQRTRARMDVDVAIHCQQIAASLSRACRQVSLDDLAISIWLCQADGSFDRRYRFFLPYDRNPTGVTWKRGVGVAGMAWKTKTPLAVDLADINAQRRAMGAQRFDSLPEDQRYGMAFADFERTSKYTGVLATGLFGAKQGEDPLAILVIDYSGRDALPCLTQAMATPDLGRDIGAAARTLDSYLVQLR